MKILVSIGGPTGSGKTDLAIRLSQHLNTEILSFDSRQIYSELDIGVGRPTEDQLAQVPHHFIDHVSIIEHYHAGRFEREADELLGQLFQKYDVVVAAGGTGLYCDALYEGLDDIPEVSEEASDFIESMYRAHGLEALQNYVQQHDPAYFERADVQNPLRLLRAAKVCQSTGRPYSSFLNKKKKETSYTHLKCVLTPDRDYLYACINRRVDHMIECGLEQEVRGLLPFRHQKALQTIGYRELFDYFDGRQTLDSTIDLIKQKSRNYAKRQLTWFRNHADWLPITEIDTEQRFLHIISLLNDLEK